MSQDTLRKRLSRCLNYALDLRLHVTINKMVSEGINQADVEEHLESLKQLEFGRLLWWKAIDGHKFKLYFRHTRNTTYKYIIDIRDADKRIRLVTLHKIHRDSQKWFEKHVHR